MSRVRAGDVTLGYETFGERGDWVVMIQGLGWGRWGWTWNAPALASDGFRVVTFDNRGIGESDAPPGPYTVEQMASDTVGLMDALGIERAHLVSASLGSFVAQHVAAHHPERVDRVVLACSAIGGPDMVPMPEITVRLIAEAPTIPDEPRLRRFVENGFTAAGVRDRQDLIEQVMAFRRATGQPLVAWMAQSAAGAAHDMSGAIGRIRAETLVVTGVEDTVVDARNSKLLADAIPNATLVETAGGHVFFVEFAKEFNALVSRFLKEGRA